jgi:hypothetical protein
MKSLHQVTDKAAGNINRKKFGKRWRAITRDEWVLKKIDDKLKINMMSRKDQEKEPREMEWETVSKEQWEWREKALEWGAIERVPEERIGEKGELVHNLVAEAKQGRLCSNTRELNRAVKKMKMRMESIRDVRQRFKEGQWLLSIDLSKFYWTLGINPAHRKYFRFRMEGDLWQWKGLPFGFRNSMQIMARIMAPVIAKLEELGVEVINWVDDFVFQLGADYGEAMKKAVKAVELLVHLGFYINTVKSGWYLTKEVTFRGFVWNTDDLTVRAPADKLEDIIKAATKVQLSMESCTPRQMASLIGKVRYVAQVHVHTIAYIVELEIFKNELIKLGGWDCKAPLPEAVREEVRHWIQRTEFITMPMRFSTEGAIWTMGDAGPLGFGFEGLDKEIAGTWTEYERIQSTNFREITTWKREVYAFSEELMDEVSFYGTDSTVAKCYISKIYGKEPVLARLVAKVWKFMETRRIMQIPVHISQEEIASSDHLSRLRDKFDFTVPQGLFQSWCDKFRIQPTLDAFATRFSAKTERFCCIMRDSQAVSLDAFAMVWRGEVVYAFPPAHLIHKVLTKVEEEEVTVILVHPLVKAASWYHRVSKLASMSISIPPEEVEYPNPDLAPPWRWRISVIRGNTHQ